jgi:hypothetical protein
MFRDGFVLVDASSPSPLPHEEIVPSRVDSLVREWSESAVQETPVTVLVEGSLPPRLIIADGHHRCAAARELAELRGKRVAVAARFFDEGATIQPAHRVFRQAPLVWVERLRDRLGPGKGPLAFCARGSRIERFNCKGLSAVEQMRLLHELDDGACEWTIEGDSDQVVRAHAAIIVPALTLDDVLEAATTGRLLPPRSTNFQPKPPESSIRFVLTDASSNVAISS